MDPREYVDARWSALIRAAVLLGASEADAPTIVRQVLDDNERRIRRAEDPDPLIHRALTAAIPGAERTAFAAEADPLSRQEMLIEPAELMPAPPAPPRGRRRWPVAVAALAVLAVVAGRARRSRAPTRHRRTISTPTRFRRSSGTPPRPPATSSRSAASRSILEPFRCLRGPGSGRRQRSGDGGVLPVGRRDHRLHLPSGRRRVPAQLHRPGPGLAAARLRQRPRARTPVR